MMQTFTYPALFEPGDAVGVVVASFPDIPEAITEGEGRADARRMAADALGTALLAYVRAGRALPRPGRIAKGLEAIAVEPTLPQSSRSSLLSMRPASVSASSAAVSARTSAKSAASSIPCTRPRSARLTSALRTLGRRLVVGVEKVPEEA